MEWLEPWAEVPTNDPRPYEGLHPDHPLAGHQIYRVARRWDQDEVLFEVLTDPPRWAVVHLTWQDVSADPDLPHTRMFDSLEAFAADCMAPDHQAWLQQQS